MTTRAILGSRKLVLLLGLAMLATAMLAVVAWRDTMGDPVVHRTSVELSGLPAGADPVTIALMSDIHVAGPDMPPERLEQIVEQINALGPDVVMIAGDMIGDRRLTTRRYTPEEAIAPLGKLDAPLGAFVAPGNHDHWTNLPSLAAAMERHGVTLLVNKAVQAGPLIVGGLDDAHTSRDDIPGTVRQMGRHEGARVMLSHSPDAFPNLPDSVPLMLAGHTHCGQIAWPWGGAPLTMSAYGNRYSCGRVDENGQVLVTTAGLGTSGIPLRLFAPRDIWLIEGRPPNP